MTYRPRRVLMPPTSMTVGASDFAFRAGESHSNDTGPQVPTPYGPAFPNLMGWLAKSFPCTRAWWQEAKTRLFEIAEVVGENEAGLMAVALVDLEALLRKEPGPPNESLAQLAARLGCPRQDLALLVADKVKGVCRMGSAGTVLPPVNGIPRGTPPRAGMMFDALTGQASDGGVMVAGGSVFPAKQIAHALRLGDPMAHRFVAGASAAAARGSLPHAQALSAVRRAQDLDARASFVAHYGALGRAIHATRQAVRAGALAYSSAADAADWNRQTRAAWHESGDLS